MTYRKNRRGLILPPSATVSRRDALKMGAYGIGGLAVGGSLLAACGDDEEAAPATTTAAPATTAAPVGKDKIKANWVYIGPPDDNGWSQEHDRGRLAVEAHFGDRVETGYTQDVGFDASTSQVFQQLVDDGNDIILSNTEYAGLLTDVADANPETKFCEINGHYFSDNVLPFYLAHETTAYQLGVAAGLLAENGRIGYIGAFPTATTFNDVNGMLLGARSVNPDAVVETVLVSTFFDPQKAAQAANALLDTGVGFLFGVMDEPTFLQLAEQAGVWTGYWNLDFRTAAPTKYVSHFDLSEFGPFYIEQCQRVLDGTWVSQDHIWLLDTPIGDWGPNVPQDVQDPVADVAAKLDSGELNVYEGPLYDNEGTLRLEEGETLDSIEAYAITYPVEGVSGVSPV